MARITVEDSLEKARNRFALVLLSAQRTKQLLKGSNPLSERTENREIVTSLREIADGKVTFDHPEYFRRLEMGDKYIESDEELIEHHEDSD